MPETLHTSSVSTPEQSAATPERAPTLTGKQFAQTAQHLEQALKVNPNAQFEPDQWLNDLNGNTDNAVYARVLERVKATDTPLYAYETDVLQYMQHQTALNFAEATVDPNLAGESKTSAIKELIAEQKALLEEGKGNETIVAALEDSLQRLESNTPLSNGNELSTYASLAESNRLNNVQGVAEISPVVSAFNALNVVDQRMRNDLVTNTLLGQKFPSEYKNQRDQAAAQATSASQKAPRAATPQVTPGKELVPVSQAQTTPEQQTEPESQELIDAKQHLADLRARLATFNSKREKRMFFTDGRRRYTAENKALYEEYHKASRVVFGLQNPNLLDDESLSNIEKIKMIAEHTVAEAKNLDQAILESYKNTKTFFGKAIEKYGNLSGTKKIIFGVFASAAVGIATGGAGTFAVSGSLIAATLEAKRRERRAGGANMLSFDTEKLAENYAGYDLSEENAIEHVDTIFDATSNKARNAFEDRIDSEQKRRLGRIAGGLAAGATIGYVTHNFAPWGMFDGLNTPADHAAYGAPVPDGADPSQLANGGNGAEQLHGWWGDGSYTPDHIQNMGDLPSWGSEVYSGPSDVFVNPGDGFYNVFDNMNIPQDQWNSILEKVGPDLVQHGDAYWMPDGTPGISSPGMLSQHAVDAIKQAAMTR